MLKYVKMTWIIFFVLKKRHLEQLTSSTLTYFKDFHVVLQVTDQFLCKYNIRFLTQGINFFY